MSGECVGHSSALMKSGTTFWRKSCLSSMWCC